MQRYLTTVVTSLALLALMAGCGKKNESGKGGVQNVVGNGLLVPGTVNVTNIVNSVQCTTGYQQRIRIDQTSSTGSVAVNSAYVGITLEGDVAFLTADANGRPVFTAFACVRAGIQDASQASAATGVIPNKTNRGCPFDELVANLTIGGYYLAFFPLHLSTYKTAMGCKY